MVSPDNLSCIPIDENCIEPGDSEDLTHFICYGCKPGYMYDEVSHICVECSEGCIECDKDGCINCDVDNMLLGDICIPRIANCTIPWSDQPTGLELVTDDAGNLVDYACKECEDLYYPFEGRCDNECTIDHCTNCVSKHHCISCQDGFIPHYD